MRPLSAVKFISPDGEAVYGLEPVKTDVHRVDRIDEVSALQDAAAFNSVDFVFFRRFADRRSSQVAAYVIDNTKRRFTQARLADLHKELWRHGVAPLIYIAWPTRVDVLSCARGPDFWTNDVQKCEYKPAETIPTMVRTAAAINTALCERFAAYRLADGTFWDDPANASLANQSETAHAALISAIVDADASLGGSSRPALRRLLLLTVLVKYLEDRGVFPPNWFGSYGAPTFFDVLRSADPEPVFRMLEALEAKFNGDVFALPQGARSQLTTETLREFAFLVEARTLNSQRFLWEQYSFSHLPVEVVSHLYQRFVKGGQGAVYTPPFLAALLLDQAMPYSEMTGRERILDPACGSGVFLVGAFRRLVQHWRSRNGWAKPSVGLLKSIVSESIFGVDLDSSAVDLAAFSLALAICDSLKPEVIWSALQFDRLRDRNLIAGDFFDQLVVVKGPKPTIVPHGPLGAPFDIVLGNPPFSAALTPQAQRIDGVFRRERGSLPDKQSAYLFLETSLVLLAEGGRLCLVQPAGILYNSKPERFRASMLKRVQLEVALDFVSIRGIFARADTKVVALLIRRAAADPGALISHLTFRRTFSVEQRICFELDHYDNHDVTHASATTDPHIWRINLLGGGRLARVAERLLQLRTLEQYVASKSDHGWDYGEGFIVANEEPREEAKFLTGKTLLPTDAFTAEGIDESKLATVTDTHFRSAYTKTRYSSPLVLIKEHATLPIAFWTKGFLAYRDKIVGIHAPPTQADELKKLYEYLRENHRTCQFACVLRGTQALVGKATAILKQDIGLLPYPVDVASVRLSFWEDVLRDDVLTYMTDFIRLGQESVLLKEAASSEQTSSYAKMFCRLLGSVYDNLRELPEFRLPGLICQPFCFGNAPALDAFGSDLRHALESLVYGEQGDALRTVRVVRFYESNTMVIVKPDRLRYWICTAAIRDADDTMADLLEQGY
ncbi:MAG: N-6 DNA methylase [Polyangiaceae bacterium]|nr:N-6 DNA methylase [Polyangiaceae bacterium]